MTKNVITNVSCAVVWSASEECHSYAHDVDVYFENGVVTSIGSSAEPPREAVREIDGRGLFLTPGFINTHTHLFIEPMLKGLTDEVGSRNFYMSSLYEYLFLFENDDEGARAACEVALCELLLSGVTTVCDLSVEFEGWIDLMVASGIRSYLAPMYRSGRWYTDNGHEILYGWTEDKGECAFERALKLVDAANAHPCGRLAGMICPAQIDTCTEELLVASMEAARERQVPFQIHAAQSVNEFAEIMRRTGKTPIGWLENLGLLGSSTIIGHAIFLDHHSWLHWSSKDDLTRLERSRTSVAHCPTVFSRRGITLQDLKTYRKHAVNVTFGTDTFPHNFIEEMRTASILARVSSGDANAAPARDLFDAATINGARALGRGDIGKIAVGAKADFVLSDLSHVSMRPMYDPVRSLIYAAADRAVRHVFVDGKQVVADGQVKTLDHQGAGKRLEEAQRRSIAKVPYHDWAGREVETLMPRTFETLTFGSRERLCS